MARAQRPIISGLRMPMPKASRILRSPPFPADWTGLLAIGRQARPRLAPACGRRGAERRRFRHPSAGQATAGSGRSRTGGADFARPKWPQARRTLRRVTSQRFGTSVDNLYQKCLRNTGCIETRRRRGSLMHRMGTLISALALVLAVLSARADDVADLLPSAIAGALSPTVGTDRSVAAGQGDGPSVDLLVGFEGDTHRLTIAGMKTLRTLAAALLDPSLDGMRFDIVGHAFLPNKPAAAQPLSARRAQAVAEHLTGFYDLDPSRFVTVTGAGASSTRSTNPADPMNQRIEIIRAGAN
ncbi:hypothetical protein DKT77_11655 [Meridianimarinicoccus roseus]|uniref:OmpA-like domain-containing protein n=1 Tax=Meridianimarinicoccus roseus TaxID=2072018 RepID=A0A2V2LKX8_9RHOB|nr:hypothetical protein DKT77_11655 [Meridianimarinicoccus roseus]